MIQLKKGEKPQILIDNEDTWNADYVAFIRDGIGTAECEERHRHPQIRSHVMAEAFGKCIYCEEKILSSQYGDVEHIMPKKKYPEKYVTWSNLALSCTKCNNAKREKEGVIDPFSEDPNEYVYFRGPMLCYRHGSEKGISTIRGIQLNRAALIEKRAKTLQGFIDKIDLMYSASEPVKTVLSEELVSDLEDSSEFAGLLRAYFADVIGF